MFILISLFFSNHSVLAISGTLNFIEYTTYEQANDRVYIEWNSKINDVEYARFELWKGNDKVLENTGPTGTKGYYFRCNGAWRIYYFNNSGSQIGSDTVTIWEIQSEASNCNPPEEPEPEPDPNPPEEPEPDPTNDICSCIFKAPEWNEYMDNIDIIIGKIPPPPDWDSVAEKFRDKIVPAFMDDLKIIIGDAPPPRTNPVNDYPDLDYNLQPPTGGNAPGLENSGFNADDIKNSAPIIEEREDPTGGFNILDPIGSLPTQEEFKENIPEEGDNFAPEVPDVPEDNVAPTPPEQENPFPSDPEDTENIAPTPGDIEGEPPTPNDDIGTAPIPGDEGGTAPTPGDDIGTAPIPGDSGETAPLPGQDNSTAPIPGADNSTAPIPGQGTETAPLPE